MPPEQTAPEQTGLQQIGLQQTAPEQTALDLPAGDLGPIAWRARALPAHVVVGRRAAAWLWGVDVLPPGVRESAWEVELLVPRGVAPPRRPGCRGHVDDVAPGDVTDLGGVRVTSLDRTALDCARRLPRLEAVAALDRFLRRGVRPERLRERALALAGRPSSRRLREVIALGDPGAGSSGESWTRALLVDAGLPRPRTQVPVPGPAGEVLRIDLGYEEFEVGVEYDGQAHHSTPRDRAHDRSRRGWLRRRGWLITVVTKHDVWGDPRPFLADVLDDLLARGWHPGDDHLCDVLAAVHQPPGARRRA